MKSVLDRARGLAEHFAGLFCQKLFSFNQVSWNIFTNLIKGGIANKNVISDSGWLAPLIRKSRSRSPSPGHDTRFNNQERSPPERCITARHKRLFHH